MVDQTTMNGRRPKSPAAGMGRSMAGLLHDLISLVELQTQLVAVDLKEGAGRSLFPVILIAGAILLTLGTMPVILLGVGWALVNLAGFSEGAAFLLVSIVALVAAGAAVWWGLKRLQSALSVLSRSGRELTENVRWIKQALENDQAEAYRREV